MKTSPTVLLIALSLLAAGCQGTSQATRVKDVAASQASTIKRLEESAAPLAREIQEINGLNAQGRAILQSQLRSIEKDIARAETLRIQAAGSGDMDGVNNHMELALATQAELAHLRQMMILAEACSADPE